MRAARTLLRRLKAARFPSCPSLRKTDVCPTERTFPARLTLLLPDGTEFQTISTRIEINERGNTSRRFPKKSYRVKIVDEEGQKQDLSIAGLRSDDDWILNPLYTDTSKIREALAYDLWAG